MADRWNAVRSFALWSLIALISVLLFWPGLLAALLGGRNGRGAHAWAGMWARLVFRLHPSWRLTVEGQEIPAGRPFVIVCNHQSTADIIVTFHLRHQFRFISKGSNFRLPFCGWYMRLCGYIPLERASKASIARCFELARRKLADGISVLFYPEGTRSRDGSIHPFKPGAFHLAIDSGVDVLPIAVAGTGGLLPKDSYLLSREVTRCRMIIGTPIPVAGLRGEDVAPLAERARQAIVSLIDTPPERAPVPASAAPLKEAV